MVDLNVEVGPDSINMGSGPLVPNMGTTGGRIPPGDWREELRRIAAAHRVTVEAIMSERRTRPVAWARFEAMKRLRVRGWSFPKIGLTLGGRDHTTAMNGVARFDALVAEGKIQPLIF